MPKFNHVSTLFANIYTVMIVQLNQSFFSLISGPETNFFEILILER